MNSVLTVIGLIAALITIFGFLRTPLASKLGAKAFTIIWWKKLWLVLRFKYRIRKSIKKESKLDFQEISITSTSKIRELKKSRKSENKRFIKSFEFEERTYLENTILNVYCRLSSTESRCNWGYLVLQVKKLDLNIPILSYGDILSSEVSDEFNQLSGLGNIFKDKFIFGNRAKQAGQILTWENGKFESRLKFSCNECAEKFTKKELVSVVRTPYETNSHSPFHFEKCFDLSYDENYCMNCIENIFVHVNEYESLLNNIIEQYEIISNNNSVLSNLLLQSLRNEHPSAAKYLIEAGANVNVKGEGFKNSENEPETPKYWTPLHFVAHFGYLELAKILIEKGADVGNPDNERSPVQIAVENKNFDVLDILLWEDDVNKNGRLEH